ncbi:MAG TPA: metal ABC transporter permease [Syntrophomonadaceae bacterium]|nr:metal ABC transporter permease [Syntrophomonadaceae bacterium]
MNTWYLIIGHLPFGWVHYTFMKNALLAVILVTPVFGICGTMVVNNRMAFFSDAMGHAALTGVAIGVIMGMENPLWAMLAFAALLATAIAWVHIKTDTSLDTVIGVFFAATVALGVIILSRGGGFNKYSKYLIGDLLSITPAEIYLLLAVLIIVIVVWLFFFNRFFLVSFNPTIARSRGANLALIELLFTIMLALIVTLCIRWVGVLIINSLLILPAAAARNLTTSMRSYHLTAILISVVSGLVGLVLSFYWGTATGATIVWSSFIVYLGSILWGAGKGKGTHHTQGVS